MCVQLLINLLYMMDSPLLMLWPCLSGVYWSVVELCGVCCVSQRVQEVKVVVPLFIDLINVFVAVSVYVKIPSNS